jgi:putative transposase
LPLSRQCELLGISRGVYYYIPRKIIDAKSKKLMDLVDEVYTKYPFFGTRQMSDYLNNIYVLNIGRKKMRTIYGRLGLESLAPKPSLSKPNKQHKVYPYLLRGVNIARKNQVWSTDITYIRLTQGFVYLTAIIDWYSRYVLDWELSISLDADFCIDTLVRVLKNNDKCEIFNTDQGAQFTCNNFIKPLLDHKILISMDGVGRALDNIFVERLWRSLKYECIYLQTLSTVDEAVNSIKEYFEFYNFERPHQSLAGKTPAMIYHGLKPERKIFVF